MKKRNNVKKLKLSKETLGVLDPKSLEGLAGAAVIDPAYCPRESVMICSVMHTCVSCQNTDLSADCA
jgi:hypothetical protein